MLRSLLKWTAINKVPSLQLLTLSSKAQDAAVLAYEDSSFPQSGNITGTGEYGQRSDIRSCFNFLKCIKTEYIILVVKYDERLLERLERQS